jgi:hypothetical protein
MAALAKGLESVHPTNKHMSHSHTFGAGRFPKVRVALRRLGHLCIDELA